jgi:hypothetical protein
MFVTAKRAGYIIFGLVLWSSGLDTEHTGINALGDHTAYIYLYAGYGSGVFL